MLLSVAAALRLAVGHRSDSSHSSAPATHFRKPRSKLIARTMAIGKLTLKGHLTNLFGKLNAASRRRAVDRARLLGLIAH